MPGATVSGRWGDATERFWANVDCPDDASCWLWTGALDADGYGTFRVDSRKVRAHRFAYELLVGPIANAMVLDHVLARGCLHRRCVNPAHLEQVPNVENVARGMSPSAINSRATHCIRDHELSGDNLFVTRAGKRQCRVCSRVASKRRLRARRDGLPGLPPCADQDCSKPSYVKGLCNAHYLKSRRSPATRKETV